MSFDRSHAEPVGPLGKAIRKARKERDLSLREASEEAGVSFSTLSRMETLGNTYAPRADVLVAVAGWLGMKPATLGRIICELWRAEGKENPS